MITGADAITQMRKLDDIISYAENQVIPKLGTIDDDIYDDADY